MIDKISNKVAYAVVSFEVLQNLVDQRIGTGVTARTTKGCTNTITNHSGTKLIGPALSPTRGIFQQGVTSMLCAPILHSLAGDSFIRANNTIDGMAFKQLRTGIF
jgi:hypothetical protein